MVYTAPTCSLEDACLVLKEAKFTDLIVQCEDMQFLVHRTFFYYKSDFFRAAIDGDFKEKQEGLINIRETSPRTMALVIIYCYTGLLELRGPEKTWPKSFPARDSLAPIKDELADILELYQVADLLIIPGLKRLAVSDFVCLLKDKYADYFDNPDDSDLAAGILKDSKDVYDALPDGDELRAAITTTLLRHFWYDHDLERLAKERDRSAHVALNLMRGIRRSKRGAEEEHVFRQLHL